MQRCLYVVIPCYNEEEVLPETTRQLLQKFDELLQKGYITDESRILYVDDRSKDATWDCICRLRQSNDYVTGIRLSHNRGHQNALLAGLLTAADYAEVMISMDADLQDDVQIIDRMLEEYDKGNEIVYGVRSSRKKDTFFKRTTAQSFYKFMRFMGVEIVYNHADCRLTGKRAVEALRQYEEVNLFLRGIFPSIGFQYSIVEYERNERFAGESKYPLKKMLSFAWQGITSFTVRPLQVISGVGLFVSVISFVVLIGLFINKLFGYTVTGWASLICSIWLVGGMQLFCLGIIGEYIGKIYHETKKRPRYIIDENLLLQSEKP